MESIKLKTIKSTALVVGSQVYMTLYRLKDIVMEDVLVNVISKPDCQISLMEDSDRYVVEVVDTGEKIEFFRNTCEPYFINTKMTYEDGVSRLVRVRFKVVHKYEEPKPKGKPGRPKKILTPEEISLKNAPKRPRGRPRKESK